MITPDNPRMTRGDMTTLMVKALRVDGFAGEVALRVGNLPPGYSTSDAVIPAGQETARLTITAPAKAGTGFVVPTVLGTARIGTPDITHPAQGSESIMQAFGLHHDVPTKEVVIAVLEPFALTLVVSNQSPAGALQTMILAGTMNTGTETVTRLAPALSLKVGPAVKAK